MSAQDGKFVAGAVAGLAGAALLLGALLPAQERTPLRPRLPEWTSEYVSAYNGVSVSHLALIHGFFGIGRRLAEADILLAGSSHAELGLSAAELSSLLLESGGRGSAYNIGVGWGEGFRFSRRLMELHDLRCKTVVIELYAAARPLTGVAERGLSQNPLAALGRILDSWMTFLADWTLDFALPRLTKKDGEYSISRRLNQVVAYRRWIDGDVAEYWSPRHGPVFRLTPPELVRRPDPTAAGEQVGSGELALAIDPPALAARRVRPVAIFIPTSDDAGTSAVGAAAAVGLKVIPLSPEGVELFDPEGHHTNARGRSAVTGQLAAAAGKVEGMRPDASCASNR